MHIPVKIDYGVRALVDLTHHAAEGQVRASDIAARQRIPEAYLDRLLHTLSKEGLVASVRGPQGGHSLAQDPGGIRLTDVVASLGGWDTMVECLDDPTVCVHSPDCAQRGMWQEMEEAVASILERTTIAALAARTKAASAAAGGNDGRAPKRQNVNLLV